MDSSADEWRVSKSVCEKKNKRSGSDGSCPRYISSLKGPVLWNRHSLCIPPSRPRMSRSRLDGSGGTKKGKPQICVSCRIRAVASFHNNTSQYQTLGVFAPCLRACSTTYSTSKIWPVFSCLQPARYSLLDRIRSVTTINPIGWALEVIPGLTTGLASDREPDCNIV